MEWLEKDQNLLNKGSTKSAVQSKKPGNNNGKQSQNQKDPSTREKSIRENSNQRLPIHKWKIRYDGADNGRRLNEFLREIEFSARSEGEGYSDNELYNSAYLLLVGKARAWFMEVNSQNDLSTWDNLVSELKRESLPPDLDYQYERQAHLRKQGTRERFQDYYLDMTRIFRNMSVPLDEPKKFQILFRNLRFEYKSAMLAANISTISKMREFGKNFDAINWKWFARNEKERRGESL